MLTANWGRPPHRPASNSRSAAGPGARAPGPDLTHVLCDRIDHRHAADRHGPVGHVGEATASKHRYVTWPRATPWPAGLALLHPLPTPPSSNARPKWRCSSRCSHQVSSLPSLSGQGWRLPLRPPGVDDDYRGADRRDRDGRPVRSAAVLLGAISPTDPVLASDVQLREAADRDRASARPVRRERRCGISVRDARSRSARPHDLGTGAWRWLAVDVPGQLRAASRLAALRYADREAGCSTSGRQGVGRSRRVPHSVIALAWPAVSHTGGFRRWPQALPCDGHAFCGAPIEGGGAAPTQISKAHERADGCWPRLHDPEVQGFNEQLERIAEVAIVLVVGAMLSYTYLHSGAVWLSRCCSWSCVPYRCGLAARRARIARSADHDLVVRYPRHRSIYYLIRDQQGLPQPWLSTSSP
jgi:hypothetical protein